MTLLHLPLHLGPLDNNTFVVAHPETREAAVIDVGFEPERAIAAVREAGLTVRHLLNTHAHYDHVAGMGVVQKALGGSYWLHPADRPLLDRVNQQAAAFGFPMVEPPEDLNDLADGTSLPLGDQRIEVLHTPGHSPGGVCFLWDQWLWAGDTLFAGSIGRTDLPGGSFEALERSIRTRLFPLGDGVEVFTGHGPFTTIGRERRSNPFVGEAARLA
jgi:glyoxylase-like metal-dependent hydrolase (beta-lactamase superfamily II)